MMNLLPEYALSRVDTVHCTDALTLMYAQRAQSVDAIITDLPYGTTACSWDTIIPFDALWAAVRHCLKPRGVFVTTASQPFTSALVMSNPKWFRYEWVWDKKLSGNFLLAAYQPLKVHENILVFSPEGHNYYPQMTKGIKRSKGGGKSNLWSLSKTTTTNDDYHPSTIIQFPNTDRVNAVHPTQKPTSLFEYLIRTYTQPGELVLDPVCGSGTTAIAARNTGRHWICGDSDAGYVEIARQRFMTGTERLNRKADAPFEDKVLPDGTLQVNLFAQAEAVNA